MSRAESFLLVALAVGFSAGAFVVEVYEAKRLPRTGEVRSHFEPDNFSYQGGWVHQIGSLSGQRYTLHTEDAECVICGPVSERKWWP